MILKPGDKFIRLYNRFGINMVNTVNSLSGQYFESHSGGLFTIQSYGTKWIYLSPLTKLLFKPQG